jgi:hypothetical protein
VIFTLALAAALAQDAVPPPASAPTSDPWTLLGVGLGSAVTAWLAEHIRSRRNTAPADDLSPLLARSADGGILLLQRLARIEESVHDLASALAVLARAVSDDASISSVRRRRPTGGN